MRSAFPLFEPPCEIFTHAYLFARAAVLVSTLPWRGLLFALGLAGLAPGAGPRRRSADAKAKAVPELPPKTFADVPYGDHPRQVLDFCKADPTGRDPAPLVVYIHGGGWDRRRQGAGHVGRREGTPEERDLGRGDQLPVRPTGAGGRRQAAGEVAAGGRRAGRPVPPVEGRPSGTSTRRGSAPPAARPVPARRSGWRCTTTWRKPDSADPVARESTRLTCAAVVGAQTSLDPQQTRAWMPNMRTAATPSASGSRARPRAAQFQEFYDHRDEVLPWIKEYSPYEHAGPGDPPVFLDYPNQNKPARVGEEQTDPTHSAVLGLKLQEKLRESGDEAHLSYPGHKDPEYADCTVFLIAKLRPRRP